MQLREVHLALYSGRTKVYESYISTLYFDCTSCSVLKDSPFPLIVMVSQVYTYLQSYSSSSYIC